MDRRSAIRQMFVLAGGMMIATSCSGDGSAASIELNSIKMSASDEALLADIVEGIIPKTDTPGGKELKLHLFVMKMVDDCHSPEEQELFLAGLKDAKSLKGKGTIDVQSYLQQLGDEDAFAKILKQRTIQGFLNSEYVMKNKIIYELVPGRYNGAVKVNG
ncbi:gluconate 2-dehydrogenase subunit 3 family protein [Sphingobacterium paludis]|uniref:Gluconate 2-dehydrogenase subunit 3-like protein n=1 Tax=Sphingobacterium paludis TaxID=1476465 RepID=A0A4V3E0Y5_9SPHI|nr:gluconate 2-dehydrogenase subunit 3 family protein [Sphingobacterium paludis]TDS10350.1 gluconate 2-dehydrogenase subunit 3-like protein [Sphingobacterium paludis]